MICTCPSGDGSLRWPCPIHPAALRADAYALGTVSLLAEAATVTDVDTARRIIEGTVVPYGEPGRTNLGLRAVAAGAVQFRQPADPRVIGLYGHDRERTVSRLAAYEDTPSALRARFRVARTPLGDQLLAEAAEGVRSMLSIELDGVRYDPAGNIVGGLCEFVAHVPIGAYDSARVDSVAASLHTGGTDDVSRRSLSPFARSAFGRDFITVGGGQPQQPAPAPAAANPAVTPAAQQPAAPAPQLTATAAEPVAEPAAAPAAPAIDYVQLAAHLAPHLTAASAPAGLPTGGLSAVPAAPGLAPSAGPRPDGEDPVARAASLQAAICRGEGTPELRAALNDITNTGLSIFQSPPGSLGEKLWEGASYNRRFVGLMRQKPLTSWKFTGWRWINRPALADYAGDKAAVPSNTVSVDQVEGTASRLAGAWDIDRKFVDFGDAEFWTELYTATAESYLEQSDARAASALISYAIDVTADPATWPTLSDGATAAYALPSGYSTGAGGLVVTQSGVLQAAALLTAILEDTPRVRMRPDYVIMNTEDWLSLVNLTNLDLPAFLALLGVDPAGFQRHPEVPKGHVIAGVRNGATFRELGSTPIRVQAQNIAQGGVDEGCFGYTGISMDKPGAIISVPITEPA